MTLPTTKIKHTLTLLAASLAFATTGLMAKADANCQKDADKKNCK